jgi:hypothetical protein
MPDRRDGERRVAGIDGACPSPTQICLGPNRRNIRRACLDTPPAASSERPPLQRIGRRRVSPPRMARRTVEENGFGGGRDATELGAYLVE